MSFQAALDALVADAHRWDETADGLEDAKNQVVGLSLRPYAFSFAAGGVADLYTSLRSRVQDLLEQGESAAGGAATALRQVRATYEGADQGARERISALWTLDD